MVKPNRVLIAAILVVLSIFVSLFNHQPKACNSLQNPELLLLPHGAKGPESLAFDRDGQGPYVSAYDGRILKWQSKEQGWTEFAVTRPPRKECEESHGPELEHICGRPLGLRFNQKTGDLYIADAYFGLLKVGPEGGLAMPLVTQAQDRPFKFTNDIDIDQETGVIYFTDSSSNYPRRKFLSLVMSGDKTGRVLKYDPSSKETTVLVNNMSMPNGVALGKDGSFLLFTETTTCRIIKLWLKTHKAGSSEVLMELPGFPDNIRRSPGGDFWVSVFSRRAKFTKWFLSYSQLGRLLLRVVPFSVEKWYSYMVERLGSNALAMKISGEGKVLESLEDKEGKTLKFTSEVDEMQGRLWFASLVMPYVAVYKL
ncbi:protein STRICTOSIDINE SYNTHASE-LIKE 10-like [Aristolochia californica]|uniref:protein STRICTOSIDINE SYNTHASE-LIKE 10-like n=1 Tax=Aristolochia californica TaxID=171875 RepID=UPI0035DEADF6